MRFVWRAAVGAICPLVWVAEARSDTEPPEGGEPRPVRVAAHPDPKRGPSPLSEEELAALIAEGEIIVIEDEGTKEPGTATDREVAQREIALTPRRSSDDLLRLVPGLYVSRHASEGKAPQIFLRGFDAVHGSDLEVSVAGLPVNEMSNVHGHGYVDLGFVIPEVISALHAHKGSFGLGQGNFATAGSVAMELGVPRAERGARVRYGVGSTNRHRLLGVIAPEGEPEATFTAFEAMTDEGFGENRGARRLVGLAQHEVPLGADGGFARVTAGAASGRFGEPGTLPLADVERGAVARLGSYAPDSEGRSRRAFAVGRLHGESDEQSLDTWIHAGWRSLDLDENFTGFLQYPDRGDRRGQEHRAFTGGLETRLARDLGPRATLLAGGGALGDGFRQREEQLSMDGIPWQVGREVRGFHLYGGAFAGLRLSLGDLDLEGGARADSLYVEAEDRASGAPRRSDLLTQISPRAAASYQLDETWKLFAAYGRGLRTPEARAIAHAGGEGGMDEVGGGGFESGITTSDSAEIGVRARFGERLAVGAGLFGTLIGNEMVFDHATGMNLARNATRRLGAELEVEARPLEGLSLRGDLTAVDARFIDSGTAVPSAPRLLGSLEARLRRGRWRAGSRFFYLGPRPLANGARGSTAAVLDLLAGVRLGRFDFEVQVDNALDSAWHASEFHFASWFDQSQPRSEIPRLHYTPGRPFGVRAALTAWF